MRFNPSYGDRGLCAPAERVQRCRALQAVLRAATLVLCAMSAGACAAGPTIAVPAVPDSQTPREPAVPMPHAPAIAAPAGRPPGAAVTDSRATKPATKPATQSVRFRLLFTGGVTPREGRRFELRGPAGSGVVVVAAAEYRGRELNVRACPLGVPLTVHLPDAEDIGVASTQGAVTILDSGDRTHLQLARASDVVEVEVRVVGTDGRPAPGAELDLASGESASTQTRLLGRAVTDEFGVARMSVARGERYVASVTRAPGFVDAVLDQFWLRRVSTEIDVTRSETPGPFDIVVTPTGVLRVAITFDGGPPPTYVTTMLQRVWPSGARTGVWRQPEMTSRKEIGADGALTYVVNEYPALEPGEYDVLVVSGGRPSATRTVTVAERETTDVALTPGRAPGALLVELAADPAAGDGASIHFLLARLDRDAGLQAVRGSVTAAEPTTVVSGLLPGRYLLMSRHLEWAVPVNVGPSQTRIALAPPPAIPEQAPFLTVRCLTARRQSALGLVGVITRPGVDWSREGTWMRCTRLSGRVAGLDPGPHVLHVLDGLDSHLGFEGGLGPVVPFEWHGREAELYVPLGR